MFVNVCWRSGRPRGGPWEDWPVTEDLVRVLTTPSIPEGEIAKGRLEAEGIPVLLKGEADGPYRMGPIHLFVPAELEVQARLVLTATFEAVAGPGDEEDADLGAPVDEPDGSGTI